MSAEVHIGFIPRDQQEGGPRLRSACVVVCPQFAESSFTQVAGMAVAMKIQDQRRIHPQCLQYRLERWRPMKALLHRLHGVAKVPMRSEGAVSIERREPIEVRKFRNIDQRRVRITWFDQQEH